MSCVLCSNCDGAGYVPTRSGGSTTSCSVCEGLGLICASLLRPPKSYRPVENVPVREDVL